MRQVKIMSVFIVLFLGILSGSLTAMVLKDQVLTVDGFSVTLKVPEQLKIEFMTSLNAPRFLIAGPANELVVGSNSPDIYHLQPPYKTASVLATIPGWNHSVAYRNAKLFIAKTSVMYVADYNGSSTSLTNALQQFVVLPSITGGHQSRTVVVGPDERLYVSIGISGNCSDEYLSDTYPFELRRGGVFVIDESGSSPVLVPFSSGLRNPIGLAFDPRTGFLYADNAGPDNLGFNEPPEIFSRLTNGSFHGMPWFQYMNGTFQSGQCIFTPPPRPASEATAPLATFDARSTPQGIAFVTGGGLGSEFTGNALVAIHGSWAIAPGGGPETRRPPKIVMVTFSNGTPTGVVDVVTGFQRADGSRFARPSGMVMGPDGSVYFTSDGGDVEGLFRLSGSFSALPATLFLLDGK